MTCPLLFLSNSFTSSFPTFSERISISLLSSLCFFLSSSISLLWAATNLRDVSSPSSLERSCLKISLSCLSFLRSSSYVSSTSSNAWLWVSMIFIASGFLPCIDGSLSAVWLSIKCPARLLPSFPTRKSNCLFLSSQLVISLSSSSLLSYSDWTPSFSRSALTSCWSVFMSPSYFSTTSHSDLFSFAIISGASRPSSFLDFSFGFSISCTNSFPTFSDKAL